MTRRKWVVIFFAVIVAGCDFAGAGVGSCVTATAADSMIGDGVSIEYDQFTDSTMVQVAAASGDVLPNLEGGFWVIGGDFISIARFYCQGRQLCRPDSLEVLLYRSGESRKITDSSEVIFLADGSERFRLGPADVQGKVSHSLGQQSAEELATVDFSYQSFADVACADSVRFRVGDVEGTLDSASIQDWRALVALTKGSLTFEEFQDLQETESSSNQGDSDQTEPSPQIPEGSLSTPSWMQVNHERQQVYIQITAAKTSANMNGWNFNGYYDGNATIVVPEGYKITINFQNNDQVNPHSLGIDEQVGDYPANFFEATPAFEGAVTEGATRMGMSTQPGQSETITFTAIEVGEYAMVCYVPAHANQGMWIHFQVSGDGKVGIKSD